MKRGLALLLAALTLVAAGCRRRDGLWFDGDFSDATTLAKQNGSLVMLVFETEWCIWCDRLERETFADPAVRSALAGIPALKLDAEREGEELAARYRVDSYPTIIFVNSDGDEVDRIGGFLPPADFIAASRRILSGDTLQACLHRLSENPADAAAIAAAVEGLIERSDEEGAIARIEAFDRATGGQQAAMSSQLMFRAASVLHARMYSRATWLYLEGGDADLAVPQVAGTTRLHELFALGFSALDAKAQAERLRGARHDDAAVVLAMVDPAELPPERALDAGDLAFRGGHYDAAAAAYEHWFAVAGPDAVADDLETAASQLYEAGRSLDLATRMARQAWAAQPSSETADTLARLLYLTGETEDAIRLQRTAVERADEESAAGHREALRRMEAGEELDDRPIFETFQRLRRAPAEAAVAAQG